jgi:hypothetical protein
MRPFVPAILLALTVGALAAPAFAFPRISTVACDTVSTSPLRVRTTFNLDFAGPGGWNWLDMQPLPVGPAPGDTTHFYDCGAPASVNCFLIGGGFVEFYPADRSGFHDGGHFAGLSIVTNRPSPCALFLFETGLLDDSGDAVGPGCLVLDGPVPATPATWGSLKARYR